MQYIVTVSANKKKILRVRVKNRWNHAKFYSLFFAIDIQQLAKPLQHVKIIVLSLVMVKSIMTF